MILTLAWRNIWRHPRRTLVTISSIVFAVLSAIAIESLERGAQDQMVDNLARFHSGHLQLQHPDFQDEPSLDNTLEELEALMEQILKLDSPIERIAPRIETFMLAAGEQQTRGAMVLGVDPQAEHGMNQIEDRLTSGRFVSNESSGAVLSEGLAQRLHLSVGDTLVLYGQGRFGQTAAGLFPVSGLVELPLREMNQQFVYLSLQDAQWLLSAEDQATALLITPQSPRHQTSILQSILHLQDEDAWVVRTWQEMNPELLRALEFDKAQTRFIMMVLYIIIGFGLFGTILTMTLERLREFGVLLSVGMQRWTLARVVWLESLWIGMIGVSAGSFLGFLLLLYFRANPIQLTEDMAEVVLDFGFEPILPVALAPDIFLWQASILFVLSLLISIYPITRILRMDILEASRKGGGS